MKARTESVLLDEVLQALQAEQSALVQGDTDALPALSQSKIHALERLAGALRAAPGAARAAAASLATAQRLNETNAALVAARAGVNRARLDTLLALAGHAPAAGIYGVRGDLAAAPASVRASATA